MDQRYNDQDSTSFACAAIRGTAALMEMQIGMARQIIGMHSRTAAALGVPDYSQLVDGSADCSRRLVNMTTDQMLSTAQRLNETMTDLQRQFARLIEQQTRTATDEIVRGIGRVGEGAEQAIRTAEQNVSRGAQEVERAAARGAESFADAAAQGKKKEQTIATAR
jgi:hypothetical protein